MLYLCLGQETLREPHSCSQCQKVVPLGTANVQFIDPQDSGSDALQRILCTYCTGSLRHTAKKLGVVILEPTDERYQQFARNESHRQQCREIRKRFDESGFLTPTYNLNKVSYSRSVRPLRAVDTGKSIFP